MYDHKPCYGKCDKCAWKCNGGCSEWDARFSGRAVNLRKKNMEENLEQT